MPLHLRLLVLLLAFPGAIARADLQYNIWRIAATTTTTTTTTTAAPTTTTTLVCTADGDLPSCDTFERLSLGTDDWTQNSVGSQVCIISSSSDANGDGTDALCYSNDAQPTSAAAAYACAQISSPLTFGGYQAVCLGVDTSGSTIAGCCGVYTTNQFGHWGWGNSTEAYAAGTELNINLACTAPSTPWACCTGVDTGTCTWAAGDYIGIQRTTAGTCDATTCEFNCYRSLNGTTWARMDNSSLELATATGGWGGLLVNTGAVNFEVFETGNGTLPTGSACGTNN